MNSPFLFFYFILAFLGSSPLWAQEGYTEEIPGTGFSISMVKIPGGTFRLGAAEGEQSEPIEMPAFYMSAHEITFDQYLPFREKDFDADTSAWMKDYKADAITRPSPPYLDFTEGMGNRGGYPAVSMTQQAALRYCAWLYMKTGHFYRLPTEAEWEYACRAGRNSNYYFGDDVNELEEHAWYWDNSGEKYHKVGQKKPNAFGLYDLLGNVAEYTADQFETNYVSNFDESQPQAIQALPSGKYRRAVRGGAFDDDAENCSCTSRIPSNPSWQARDPQIPKSVWWNPDSPFVGFRIVRPIGDFSPEEVEAYFMKAVTN